MKKILAVLIVISLNGFGQKLSKEAKFGLVTISAGSSTDEIYQIWGHTVLHLNDPVNGINECYDYGSFNFNQPNFIGKFLQGTLPYQMTIVDFNRLVDHYKYNENRSAEERILNLNPDQKERLYQFLVNNYLPENREYSYRFFYYNCASRLRDILVQICGNNIFFDDSYNADKSYREWIDQYAKAKQPWTNLGMHLAIGLPADEKTKADGAMFLPLNLATGFDKAQIIQNGQKQPLVIEKNTLSIAPPATISTSVFTPELVLLVLALLGIAFTYYQFKRKSKNLVFDKIFFSFLGLIGWFIIGLWFFTDHGVTEQNYNVLWASPLFLPLIYFKKQTQFFKYFLYVYLAGVILMVLLVVFAVIHIETDIYPIILFCMVRILFILNSQYGLNKN